DQCIRNDGATGSRKATAIPCGARPQHFAACGDCRGLCCRSLHWGCTLVDIAQRKFDGRGPGAGNCNRTKLTHSRGKSCAAAVARGLAFRNLSNDPQQEYFANGITDDLTTDLSRLPGSFVIARNTAFTYKGKPTDAKQIGRDLGVHYVVEGSVRRTGDQVQINVQLIDAESGAHLWADRFDIDHRELANAQGEMTVRLALTLNIKLGKTELARSELREGWSATSRG